LDVLSFVRAFIIKFHILRILSCNITLDNFVPYLLLYGGIRLLVETLHLVEPNIVSLAQW